MECQTTYARSPQHEFTMELPLIEVVGFMAHIAKVYGARVSLDLPDGTELPYGTYIAQGVDGELQQEFEPKTSLDSLTRYHDPSPKGSGFLELFAHVACSPEAIRATKKILASIDDGCLQGIIEFPQGKAYFEVVPGSDGYYSAMRLVGTPEQEAQLAAANWDSLDLPVIAACACYSDRLQGIENEKKWQADLAKGRPWALEARAEGRI